jgi:hypothetical protein
VASFLLCLPLTFMVSWGCSWGILRFFDIQAISHYIRRPWKFFPFWKLDFSSCSSCILSCLLFPCPTCILPCLHLNIYPLFYLSLYPVSLYSIAISLQIPKSRQPPRRGITFLQFTLRRCLCGCSGKIFSQTLVHFVYCLPKCLGIKI